MNTLLSQLKLWQKIVLIIAAFALPVGVLAFFSFRSFEENVTHARLEQAGFAVNLPLSELLHATVTHQVLLQRYHGGEKQVETEIRALQAEVDAAFAAVERVEKQFGATLRLGPEALAGAGIERSVPAKMRALWEPIKAGWQQLALDRSEAQHEEIIHATHALIDYVDNTADLAIDPALDSAHLLLVSFRYLPDAHFQLGMVTEHGLQALAQPGLAAQVKLAGPAAILSEAILPSIRSSVAEAVAHDTMFFGANERLQREVPARLAESSAALDTLLGIAAQIEQGSTEVDRAAFVAAAERAAKAQAQFCDSVLAATGELIQARLDHFVQRRLMATALVLGALALAGLLTWLVVRNITGRLRRLSDAARATAMDGDLSHEIEADGTDEIGILARAFSQMVTHLCTLTGQVQKAAVVVNASVTEIAATSKQQQTTTSEVAATTTEIGATSKEISATSRELVKTVNQVAEVADETATLANSGQASLGRMEETMGHFVEAVSAINSKLAVLNEKAGNINQVVTTITKVADQTNLLSLNAAIEAEKAGEYGRGFAVVATEIRRLADQTAVATFDIEQMVKEMQSAVAAGVMGMDKFGEQVRRGVQEVQQVSGQLGQIITQVQTLSPRFATVNEGMQAQATGADQITQALTQLSEATQQTAESLRQSNLSIEQLHDASRGMLTSLDGFKLRTA